MAISFADPYGGAVQSITVDEYLSSCLLFDAGWQYRGQGDSRWDLIPSAFRGDRGKTLDIATRSRILQYYHDDTKCKSDFDKMWECAGKSEEFIYPKPDSGLLMLQILSFFQHFGIPTPLIDWTSSPLVALFMATAFRPAGATEIRIWRLNPSRLPKEIVFQAYQAVRFRRIQRQLGGVMFFGHIHENKIVMHPTTYKEYVASPSANKSIDCINIKITPSDRDKVRVLLAQNGFYEEEMFPKSAHWISKSIRDSIFIGI